MHVAKIGFCQQDITENKKKSEKLSSLPSWPLKMGTIGCPKMLVWNYHSTLCEIPQEHKSQCGKTIWWMNKNIT